MTYTEVARLLESAPTAEDQRRYGPYLDDFRLMGEVAARLRERREERGSIDFDLPDADIVLDDEGLVVGIVPEARNVAHRLIEEFMLAANEAVAKKLLFAKQPAIYRVHDRPDPDRLVDLREVLEGFGYEVPLAKVRRQIGKGGDHLLPALLPPDVVEERGKEMEAYRSKLFTELYLPNLVAFPCVRELIERVVADGLVAGASRRLRAQRHSGSQSAVRRVERWRAPQRLHDQGREQGRGRETLQVAIQWAVRTSAEVCGV